MNTAQRSHILVRQTCSYFAVASLAVTLGCASSAQAQIRQFYDTVTFPTTNYIADLAVGDVNNDGIDDIVTPYDVLLGKGDGTFQPSKKTNLTKETAQVALGDFNRDGNLDLAATITNSDDGFTKTVAILLGNGDGTFQPAREFAAARRPNSLAVADFNGDGIPDLVVGGLGPFAVLLGNGDGTFQNPITTKTNTSLSWVAAADLNGDGKADVAIGSYNRNSVSIYFGNGDGTFRPTQRIATTVPLSVLKFVDLNGDSRPDLVGSGYLADTLVVLLGKADGTFASPIDIALAGVPGKFVAGDFNNDGKRDLAISQTDPNFNTGQTALVILLGKGDGTFQGPITFGSLGGAIAAGEFNSDTALDLVGGGGLDLSVQVAYGLGNGDFTVRRDFPVSNSTVGIAAADLNHDRNLDLAVATNYPNNSVTILSGNGDGSFAAPVQYAVGQSTQSPAGIAIDDLDGDGNKDIAVTNGGADTISILLGNGDGTFRSHVDYPTGPTPSWVAIGDVNNDGHPDLVTADDLSVGFGQVSVLLGNGDGTFQTHLEYGVGWYNPTFVLIRDFNHDGKPDLAVADGDSYGINTNLSILLGRGDGTFPSHVEYAPNSYSPFQIVAADLNRDGNLDLISSEGPVWFGNGDGSFHEGTYLPGNVGGYQITAADYDRDGKLDIVTAGVSFTSDVQYLTGNGDGTFAKGGGFAVGHDPRGIISGDFNGDHLPDIITANDLNISVLLNTGAVH